MKIKMFTTFLYEFLEKSIFLYVHYLNDELKIVLKIGSTIFYHSGYMLSAYGHKLSTMGTNDILKILNYPLKDTNYPLKVIYYPLMVLNYPLMGINYLLT